VPELATHSTTTATKSKKARSKPLKLSDAQRTNVLSERIKLAHVVGNEEMPDTMRQDAAKLLMLGNVQLHRRLTKSKS
jgi:hypothetical protein